MSAARLDRGEWAGTGLAAALHLALIAALALHFAKPPRPAEAPPLTVEIISDEVALAPAAPQPPSPQPTNPLILRWPQAVSKDAPPPIRPSRESGNPAPAPRNPLILSRPQAVSKDAPARPSNRLDNLLGPPGRSAARDPLAPDRLGPLDAPANPLILSSPQGVSKGAPRFDARAKASVAALFQRLVQPCANRQTDPGPGANRIRVTLNLRLNRDGTLRGTPAIVRVSGVDDDNRRYEERVKDLAIAVYRQCSPFRGLPADLYSTNDGGWSNINLTYRLP